MPGTLLVLAGLLLAFVVLTAAAASRQRTLTRRVGSFACLWSAEPATTSSQVPGTAHYGTGRLDWWRTVSLSPRPARSWTRERLEVVEREVLRDVDALGRPMVRARCRHGGETFALTMSSAAYAGLVSWLEAGPRRARVV